ncbi:MAG: ABC transporter ATP-binding protein [Clostridia bacterium]|nr:ABC transporter ATP-binding protein [Clostridia bacterium]
MTEQKNTKDGSVLRAFFASYRPYLKTLIPLLLCALGGMICTLIIPLCVRYITEGNAQTFASLRNVGLIMLGLIVVCIGLRAVVDYFGHVLGAKMEYDIRQKLYEHLLKMPLSFFERRRVGELISNLTNDLQNLVELFHHMPEDIVLYFLQLIGASVILFVLNPQLTLAVYAILPPMLAFTLYFSAKMRKACAKSYEKIAEINTQAEDALSGIRVMKSFAAEQDAAACFAQTNEAFYKSRKMIYGMESLVYQGCEFFIQLAPVVIAVFGGWLIADESLTVHDLIPFLMYVSYITYPIQHLIHMIGQFQGGYAGFSRYWTLMQMEPDMLDGTVEAGTLRGEVEFRDVSFAYNEGEPVLEEISLKVEPGEYIAVVGHSGVGKTTLCALVSRLYDVSAGAVLVDGRDVREYTMASLRGQIGVVEQNTYLFAGTVAENIAYGVPGASREQIIDAAKRANAHEFISALPNGYDTYVGERGVLLSGGQRQRISIARVFLKDPPIVIFDEATSALDAESELAVHTALNSLAQTRTTFVIAHRLSTVRGADRTVVLEGGRIVQTGRHEELLQVDGVYKTLCSLQIE